MGGSEISSEFGMEAMIDEEQEKKFKEELLIKVYNNIYYLIDTICQLERNLIQYSLSLIIGTSVSSPI